MDMKKYITAEEFDLMTEAELDEYYDDDYHYQQYWIDLLINEQIKNYKNGKINERDN